MFQLRIIQAEYGDCFILEFGKESSPHYILIDGGPEDNYKTHLKAELEEIRDKGGILDLVILSHVDDDHIGGFKRLLADLNHQELYNKPKTIKKIKSIWHNSFKKTIDTDDKIYSTMNDLLDPSSFGSKSYKIIESVNFSIKNGMKTTKMIEEHEIPINPESSTNLISIENMPPIIPKENLNIRIIGPTMENLKKLRKEWLDWLNKPKTKKFYDHPYFKAMSEKRTVNLSSIMILAEAEGKRVLLSGDGKGDNLIEGLEQLGLLNDNGEIHVDVFKLPHHGSESNVSRDFFDKVKAHTYVISANGKHGNPDLSTLKWLVESAKARDERVTIFVTNQTSATEKLIIEYPPTINGYNLELMDKNANSTVLNIVHKSIFENN